MGMDLYQEERYLRERDLREFYKILAELGVEHKPHYERGPEALRRFLADEGVFKVPFEHTCECGHVHNSEQEKFNPNELLSTHCPKCDTFTDWECKNGYWLPKLEEEDDDG